VSLSDLISIPHAASISVPASRGNYEILYDKIIVSHPNQGLLHLAGPCNIAKKQFSNLANEYEITFENNTEVALVRVSVTAKGPCLNLCCHFM